MCSGVLEWSDRPNRYHGAIMLTLTLPPKVNSGLHQILFAIIEEQVLCVVGCYFQNSHLFPLVLIKINNESFFSFPLIHRLHDQNVLCGPPQKHNIIAFLE